MSNHIVNNTPVNNNLDDNTPKIYVACLAAYNNGILHGEWLNASLEVEEIQEKINQMLAISPIEDAEEWAIHDFENFYDLSIGEYESIDDVHKKALFVVEHGELGATVMHYAEDLEAAREALENYYQGEYESERDFAIQFFDEHYLPGIPENVRTYIDYQKFCREIFIGDCFSLEASGKTHVFWQH